MADDSEVTGAGFILPQPTGLISSGDDAIRANARAAYDLKFVFSESMSASENIDTLGAGVYAITSSGVAGDVGMPVANPGTLTVNVVSEYWDARNNIFHAHPGGGSPSRIFVRNRISDKWSKWTEIPTETWLKTGIADGTDLDTVIDSGVYGMSLGENPHRPINDGNAAVLEVFTHGHANLQRYTSMRATNQTMWLRRGNNYGAEWFDWTRVDAGAVDLSQGSASAPGRRAILRQNLRARKGGVIGTDGKAAVALRFDDAAGDFAETVLPMLKARRLPFTRVTTTDRVGNTAGGENDTWENIETYSIQSGGEVWNHGKTHGGAEGQAAIDAEVTGALDTLRTNLPRLPIDCWSPPGGQSTGWGGYMPAETIAQVTESYAGKQIMAQHALVSGYMPDSWFPPLDGIMRDGNIFYSSDIRDYAYLKDRIDMAVEFTSALTLMWHANNFDNDGHITMDDFTAILDYLVDLRDSGDLLILTVSGLSCADSSTAKRSDILRTHTGTDWAETIRYPNLRLGIPGSTRELTATVTGPADSTVTTTVGESELTHTIPESGTLTIRHPATIPTDVTTLTVSIIGADTDHAHLYPV